MEIYKDIGSYSINGGWRLVRHDMALEGVMCVPFGEEVEAGTRPHENIKVANHKSDPETGVDFADTIESYRFISCWFKTLRLEGCFDGERVFLEFDGVATAAEVYVNGHFAGGHKGAYTGFSLDVTEYAAPGENFIAVRVDSTRRPDIPPEGGEVDYCLFGGIVRGVRLRISPAAYIDDVFVTSDISGEVCASVTVKNSSSVPANAKLKVTISDAGGSVLAAGEASLLVGADGSECRAVKMKIDGDVKAWDIDSPYLYTAKTALVSEFGEEERCDRFGVREFHFTNTESESRFFIKGKKTKLLGINRHEMWPWVGRAVCDKLEAGDADLIKKSGLNAVRCSHYPQSPAFLSRCDEIGLMVLEEAPGWQHIGDEGWQELYLSGVSEMIMRDRNHPSIISWGVRVNESFDCHELYEKSNALSKSLDPTRPTHGVRRLETYEESECQEDIFAVNYTYPEKPRITPYIITEHSMDWWGGDGVPDAPNDKKRAFVDSFASAVDYCFGNDLCAGGVGWSLFDYNNEGNYTKSGHVFYSGIYDIFRAPKAVPYLYRSQKDPSLENVLYIVDDWTGEADVSDIMVLGNCDEVEIFVNGVSAGRASPNKYMNLPHPAFVFHNVAYEAGEICAVGYRGGRDVSREGSREVSRTVKTTPGLPAALRLTPEYDTLAADGADMTNVWVEIIDKNGTALPYADDKIKLEASGDGEFIGEEIISLEGGHTAFMVRSLDGVSGEIICRAEVPGGNICGECRIKSEVRA